MEDSKIGTVECIATIGCVNIIPLVLTAPTFAVQTFGTGSLSHAIFIIPIGALIFSIYFNLFLKFKNKDLIDISEIAGGKFLKYLSGFFIVSFLLTTTVVVLSEFDENIRNILFQNVPANYIFFLFAIGMFFGVYTGIKGIFRTATVIAPLILISILIMFFSLVRDVDVTNFTPIFGNNVKDFFLHGTFRFEIFEGLFLIFLMGTQVRDVKKAAIGSFITVSLIVLLIAILIFGIFPYPSILENYFPFFELTRLISFGRFLQRLESIYTLLWLLAVYVYISVNASYAIQSFSKIFNLKYPKRIIPMFCVLILTMAIFLGSYIDVLNLRKFLTTIIIPLIVFLYFFIVCLVAVFKQRRRENEKS